MAVAPARSAKYCTGTNGSQGIMLSALRALPFQLSPKSAATALVTITG